jgi:hypothetical protein
MHDTVGLGVGEAITSVEGSQPAVDGGRSVTESLAMGDVSIHVVEGDCVRGVICPGEEELHIARVVDMGRGLGDAERNKSRQPGQADGPLRPFCRLLVSLDTLPTEHYGLLAPRVGLEPTANRLTAGRSAN